VHEWVHVRGGDVVLLIPRRRRQHDVGIGAGAGHPEVDGREQVELAAWCRLAPGHLARA
jgi:hypothetical protein